MMYPKEKTRKISYTVIALVAATLMLSVFLAVVSANQQTAQTPTLPPKPDTPQTVPLNPNSTHANMPPPTPQAPPLQSTPK